MPLMTEKERTQKLERAFDSSMRVFGVLCFLVCMFCAMWQMFSSSSQPFREQILHDLHSFVHAGIIALIIAVCGVTFNWLLTKFSGDNSTKRIYAQTAPYWTVAICVSACLAFSMSYGPATHTYETSIVPQLTSYAKGYKDADDWTVQNARDVPRCSYTKMTAGEYPRGACLVHLHSQSKNADYYLAYDVNAENRIIYMNDVTDPDVTSGKVGNAYYPDAFAGPSNALWGMSTQK